MTTVGGVLMSSSSGRVVLRLLGQGSPTAAIVDERRKARIGEITETRMRGDSQLVEDVGHVPFDGLDRDVELVGDLLVALASPLRMAVLCFIAVYLFLELRAPLAQSLLHRTVCPTCGASESALRLPLFVVSGASGSGKTTVYPHLVAALPECVVFDVDWLIDSFGHACAPRPISWPAVRDAWLSIAHGLAQGGRHMVLLGSLLPEHLAPVPARRWVTDIHFAVLDCSDDARRARLAARPPWREREIDDHITFAAHLRRIIPTLIPTDGSPVDAAKRVAEWVRERVGTASTPLPWSGQR